MPRHGRFAFLISTTVLLLLANHAGEARAAGGAFAVDDAAVDDLGACKVETWASFANNSDFFGAVAPACVVNLGHPVELGFQFGRAREGGEWGSSLTGKAKFDIIPIEPNGFGLALSAGIGHDVTNGVTDGVFVNVPLTFELSKQFRINVNGGWLLDPNVDQHFATWGAGFEWKLAEPVTLIGEVFGLIGDGANNDPRAQLGLRFTPQESFDIDVIYGRNLTGENAHWITVGLNVRFNVAGK